MLNRFSGEIAQYFQCALFELWPENKNRSAAHLQAFEPDKNLQMIAKSN
jgi:hypothetical protein